MTDLRNLPSVDQLLNSGSVQQYVDTFGRPLTLEATRTVLGDTRAAYREGEAVPSAAELVKRIEGVLASWTSVSLLPVINATGVILHTNLGRAPLSRSAIRAVQRVSTEYSTLEFDIAKGRRGSRLVHAESLLCRLTGAEAGLVVNNNAAAVMLVLSALAKRRKAVISRSQLVEIGGGFRIPDVMKQSGAKLLEVGTTNRVHISDYQAALEEKPALFMRAHRSNFEIVGFTSEPTLSEISAVAELAGIPVVDDLGSGTLLDTAHYGLGHEPMVQESLAGGADLVCFSGDKLLGGPQAGVIIGRKDLVNKLKKHPLARAVRADKMCLSALAATLLHYLKDEAEQEIPVWRMISTSLDAIRQRAGTWQAAIGQGEVISGESTVGGGSLPGETLPTSLFALEVRGAARFMQRLRSESQTPVIARLLEEKVVFDPRTVLPEQDDVLLDCIRRLIS